VTERVFPLSVNTIPGSLTTFQINRTSALTSRRVPTIPDNGVSTSTLPTETHDSGITNRPNTY